LNTTVLEQVCMYWQREMNYLKQCISEIKADLF